MIKSTPFTWTLLFLISISLFQSIISISATQYDINPQFNPNSAILGLSEPYTTSPQYNIDQDAYSNQSQQLPSTSISNEKLNIIDQNDFNYQSAQFQSLQESTYDPTLITTGEWGFYPARMVYTSKMFSYWGFFQGTDIYHSNTTSWQTNLFRFGYLMGYNYNTTLYSQPIDFVEFSLVNTTNFNPIYRQNLTLVNDIWTTDEEIPIINSAKQFFKFQLDVHFTKDGEGSTPPSTAYSVFYWNSTSADENRYISVVAPRYIIDQIPVNPNASKWREFSLRPYHPQPTTLPNVNKIHWSKDFSPTTDFVAEFTWTINTPSYLFSTNTPWIAMYTSGPGFFAIARTGTPSARCTLSDIPVNVSPIYGAVSNLPTTAMLINVNVTAYPDLLSLAAIKPETITFRCYNRELVYVLPNDPNKLQDNDRIVLTIAPVARGTASALALEWVYTHGFAQIKLNDVKLMIDKLNYGSFSNYYSVINKREIPVIPPPSIYFIDSTSSSPAEGAKVAISAEFQFQYRGSTATEYLSETGGTSYYELLLPILPLLNNNVNSTVDVIMTPMANGPITIASRTISTSTTALVHTGYTKVNHIQDGSFEYLTYSPISNMKDFTAYLTYKIAINARGTLNKTAWDAHAAVAQVAQIRWGADYNTTPQRSISSISEVTYDYKTASVNTNEWEFFMDSTTSTQFTLKSRRATSPHRLQDVERIHLWINGRTWPWQMTTLLKPTCYDTTNAIFNCSVISATITNANYLQISINPLTGGTIGNRISFNTTDMNFSDHEVKFNERIAFGNFSPTSSENDTNDSNMNEYNEIDEYYKLMNSEEYQAKLLDGWVPIRYEGYNEYLSQQFQHQNNQNNQPNNYEEINKNYQNEFIATVQNQFQPQSSIFKPLDNTTLSNNIHVTAYVEPKAVDFNPSNTMSVSFDVDSSTLPRSSRGSQPGSYNPSSSSTTTSRKRTAAGAIAGGVIGGFVILFVLMVVLLLCCRSNKKGTKKHKSKTKTKETTPQPAVNMTTTTTTTQTYIVQPSPQPQPAPYQPQPQPVYQQQLPPPQQPYQPYQQPYQPPPPQEQYPHQHQPQQPHQPHPPQQNYPYQHSPQHSPQQLSPQQQQPQPHPDKGYHNPPAPVPVDAPPAYDDFHGSAPIPDYNPYQQQNQNPYQ